MFIMQEYNVSLFSLCLRKMQTHTLSPPLSLFFLPPPLLSPSFSQVLGLSIHLYPAQLHSFPLSVFASLIAPFGGFFASGFKRAFNIKVSPNSFLH